jgi:GAF domain-containing protein
LLEDRLRILSGALRSFAEATSDYVKLVDVVAETLANVIHDGCVVRLLGDGGWMNPVAVHMPTPHFERVRAHICAPHNLDEQDSARQVMSTGDALLVPHFDLASMRGKASPEILEVYETIGIHSLLLVAMRVRGESIGMLSLSRFVPGSQPFDEHDRHLAQALADHAAMAITNARLVQQLEALLAERTAELRTLRGLLPICSWCKRIRDDDRGSWRQIEAYVSAHSDLKFTHGICPECAKTMKS